jgi:hypothetical protein
VLTVRAATKKLTSASTSRGFPIVNVWTGGANSQFDTMKATSAARRPGTNPPTAATASTTKR